jgi:hypothetical protein
MVNYKIQSTGNWAATPSVTQPGTESGYAHMTYEIVETQTGHIVGGNLTHDQAKSTCRRLNFGAGFDGFTPAFFMKKPKLSYDEDSFFV